MSKKNNQEGKAPWWLPLALILIPTTMYLTTCHGKNAEQIEETFKLSVIIVVIWWFFLKK